MATENDKQKYYWNRVGHVAIEDANGKMQSYGDGNYSLDFKFTIKLCVYSGMSTANIEIYGLKMATVHDLAYWGYRQKNQLRRIQVFAGYADTGEKKLFDGHIMTAKPIQPPNLGLSITASEYMETLFASGSQVVQSEMRFDELAKKVAAELGLADPTFEGVGKKIREKKVSNFIMGPTGKEMLENLQDASDVWVYIESGKLMVVPRVVNTVTAHRNAFKLDTEHGLLGICEIGMPEVKARLRLDTRVGRAGYVRIASEIYPPRARGDYWVSAVEYRGHLRGQEWETIVHAKNFDKIGWVRG